MMTSPQEQNLVSLVHPIAFETIKQSSKNRDSDRNKSEIKSLKLLALKILQRKSTRNKSETDLKNEVKQNHEKQASCFTKKEPAFHAEKEQQTSYTVTYLSTNIQGRPAFCIHCPSWLQKGNWWKGLCGVSGALVNNKSRCTVEVMEAMQ